MSVIKIDEKEYVLKYTLGIVGDLQEALHIDDLADVFTESTFKKAKNILLVLFYGLQIHHPEITLDYLKTVDIDLQSLIDAIDKDMSTGKKSDEVVPLELKEGQAN
jgi:hypothetical protein